MSAADDLRKLADPAFPAAALAGAQALERMPQMEATVAGLETSLAAATERIIELTAPPPETYVVQRGDTLLSITDRWRIQALRVAAYNRIGIDDPIHPGDVLYLTHAAPTGPTPDPDPPEPEQTGTVFGIDLGDLKGTPDAPIPEGKKLADHKTLLGVTSLQYVRVFLQSRPLGPKVWTEDKRLSVLKPGDSCHVTTNLDLADAGNRAGLKAMLDATPDHLRGRVLWGERHEMEADLTTDAAIRRWLDGNAALAEALDAADGYSSDDLVKTLLFYSQFSDKKLKGSWPKFHGGQDFGMIGMDCYHLQAKLNAVRDGKPAGSYTPPEDLFGILVEIAEQTGRPVCVPEWGGTRANTDPTGEGRAQAIRDGAAFMRAHGIRHASWWCAYGRLLDGVRLNHHLEVDGPSSPEVAAYRELLAA